MQPHNDKQEQLKALAEQMLERAEKSCKVISYVKDFRRVQVVIHYKTPFGKFSKTYHLRENENRLWCYLNDKGGQSAFLYDVPHKSTVKGVAHANAA